MNLWYIPGQSNISTRESVFKAKALEDIAHPVPQNHVQPSGDLNLILSDDETQASLSPPLLDESYTSDIEITDVASNIPPLQ